MVAKKFTNDIENFHNSVSDTNSLEEMFIILSKVKFPLDTWRDFLDEHIYFDDEELLTNWINLEKNYFKKKRAFEDQQRVMTVDLDALHDNITILAYYDDFEESDIKWIAAKALLSHIVDQEIHKEWRAFEEEYLRWKENFKKGIDKYFIKIEDDLKQRIKDLTNESLELLQKGKLEESFIKQAQIVELLEAFFK